MHDHPRLVIRIFRVLWWLIPADGWQLFLQEANLDYNNPLLFVDHAKGMAQNYFALGDPRYDMTTHAWKAILTVSLT